MSFIFLSANPPWVYNLAEATARQKPSHAVRLYDWRTYWKFSPSWPSVDPSAEIKRTLRVLPPGYAGRLEWGMRPLMKRWVRRWKRELRDRCGQQPFIIAPYPYLAPWLRDVPDNRIVYYNLDAYELYRPARAQRIQQLEAELVERSRLTVCLSKYQVQKLRRKYPERAECIRHFPLGVSKSFINFDPEDSAILERTVTYIGNLTDRVDWCLVYTVADRCPELTFRFVGGLEKVETGGTRHGWENERRRALALSNVEHVGSIPQQEVPRFYWTSAVNWIPYDVEHPFNRASCPTKIMDGLASGRPLISTPVPECTLYPEWIDIAETAASMAEALRDVINQRDMQRQLNQVSFVQAHTWDERAEHLRELLGRSNTYAKR